VATQARTGSAAPTPRPPGARGERGFIRALADHALGSVDLDSASPVLVLGLTSAELEERSGLSRPSIAGLISRFEAVLERQDLKGNPARGSIQAARWALDPEVGVVAAAELGLG
jgi:hypothetical protein